MPKLAICQQFEQLPRREYLLEHCNAEWESIGVSGDPALDDAKRQAEANYPGISKHSVYLNTTEEEALKFYEDEWPRSVCVGCGRYNFEFDRWVETEGKGFCTVCHEAENGPSAF